MFLAAGPPALRFCEWVDRLGEAARVLEATETGPIGEGVQLLHLKAQALLSEPEAPPLRQALEAARQHGALISIDLGAAEWIRGHGSSRTAYNLATIRPDVLFAGQAAAAALDDVALAAAFCVAYMGGAAPVEAAGRAVLVAARLPATTTRGLSQP